eukprot:1195771-Prorocentrum_minimum.AAC.4
MSAWSPTVGIVLPSMGLRCMVACGSVPACNAEVARPQAKSGQKWSRVVKSRCAFAENLTLWMLSTSRGLQ